jgi:hypothetical protein
VIGMQRSSSFRRNTLVIAVLLAPACAPDDRPLSASDPAPTYEELFDRYFAPGTTGHCATAGCHADPGHNVWLCADADSCYRGMRDMGLVDAADPAHSAIADPARSPLIWVNRAGGNMPLDARADNPAARAAIEAWVNAGAQGGSGSHEVAKTGSFH